MNDDVSYSLLECLSAGTTPRVYCIIGGFFLGGGGNKGDSPLDNWSDVHLPEKMGGGASPWKNKERMKREQAPSSPLIEIFRKD